MNPSTSAWIPKLIGIALEHESPNYTNIRSSGFIYGTNVSSLLKTLNTNQLNYTKEELAKINLVYLLFDVCKTYGSKSADQFIEELIQFYTALESPQKNNTFSWLKLNTSKESKLEKLITKRVQTNSNFLERNFSNILTNTFLNIDVETFRHHLLFKDDSLKFASQLEATLTNVISIALHLKSNKTTTEQLFIKLLESSLRYQDEAVDLKMDYRELNLSFLKTETSKLYLLDIACMSVFSDEQVETVELEFIHNLAFQLGLDLNIANEAITNVQSFIDSHRQEIPFFNSSNPIKHFYDRTYRSTTTLLMRNKKRLIKEIYESKELLILLSKSTHSELSAQEKKLVKEQLIDIFKSIPSLAIFALPGGGVLLPIIIKFIPKLLPSSFNENLDH